MTVVDRAGETIARSTTRRRFLQRASTVTFAAVAAWSVNVIRPDLAYACPCQNCDPGTPCTPIRDCPHPANDCLTSGDCNTAYCNYLKSVHSNTGCWCQATKCYNCSSGQNSYCGYWKCCDCACGTTHCTCQGFHYTCQGCQTASPDCVPCC